MYRVKDVRFSDPIRSCNACIWAKIDGKIHQILEPIDFQASQHAASSILALRRVPITPCFEPGRKLGIAVFRAGPDPAEGIGGGGAPARPVRSRSTACPSIRRSSTSSSRATS